MEMKWRSDNDKPFSIRGTRGNLYAWFERCKHELLAHPDYRVREAVIRAMGQHRARRHIPYLITALRERADSDYALQVAAAEALGKINDLASLPALTEAWLSSELLNVRRVARRELDQMLSAHALRGRQGFGKSHDRILNENHPFPPGSDSVHARQIDEQIRLTLVTAPLLYDTPAFCWYCAGQRPILERCVDALLPRTAPEEKVAKTLVPWLCSGMNTPTEQNSQRFKAWWRKAGRGIRLLPEWEEEAILARGKGSCDMFSRALIAICRCRQIHGRLVIWYHANGKLQHITAELFIDRQWTLCDARFGIYWNCTALDLLRRPSLAGNAREVMPRSARRLQLFESVTSPAMFAQAAIVPVDRMGIDL